MDAAERDMFGRTLRDAVAAHTGDALDAALAEVGWTDALALDAPTAVSTLFALQGGAHATSSALDHVLAHALGLQAGSRTGVILPPFGQGDPPGRVERDRLVIAGLGHASLPAREDAVIVVPVDGHEVGVTVPTAQLSMERVAGIDPALGLVEVSGSLSGSVVGQGVGPLSWSSAVDLARLALGHELVGAARTMLEMARTHAQERVQFDRAIGSFQAVRHRLAETLVAIEAADAALEAAWSDASPTAAAMAKALAGRAARTAARHCQQVLAGIGFTTEHGFHLVLRRVLVLDELFGASRPLTRDLGTELLHSRRLPTPTPL
jgi:Acyl-CoA dehydrogenase, C-terminal domain